ncbi:MAG: dCTP deaminase [Aeromonas sp.]
MILSAPRIHHLIDEGIITGLHENVNAASLDLRLSPEIMIETPFWKTTEVAPGVEVTAAVPGVWSGAVDIAAKESPFFTKMVIPEEGFVVAPGQCFLASSVEEFNLPDTISAQFILRSSVGRCFLDHMQAGFADAGFNGATLTFEFKNELQYHNLLIKPGMRIGQMVFFEHEPAGEDSYALKGNYNGQQGPTRAFSK